MTTTTTEKQENFNFFIDTITTLATSQGFYSRLLATINELNQQEQEQLVEVLPKFNDVLDVIFYLEQ